MSKTWRKLLSVLLALSMLVSLTVTGYAAGSKSTGVRNDTTGTKLELEDLDPSKLNIPRLGETIEDEEAEGETIPYKFGDIVRVSIVLDKEATLSKYSVQNVAENTSAMVYRAGLKQQQKVVTGLIERTLGRKIDVRWNLTLAMNAISANVRYGDIAMIRTVAGVKSVELENKYEPQVDEIDTSMTTDQMVGATSLWANGYTGAGSRVAIIDTGTDIEHLSFDGDALLYSLMQNAEEKGMEYDDYSKTLNLLSQDKVASVAGKLNAAEGGLDAGEAYKSFKVPFGYNYVDGDYDVTHINDVEGEHGSHVSGIAAANRYVEVDGEYAEAAKEVFAVGVAPDAQIITMKVFGKNGGAYDSDYMAAIEDAIILRCDSINLSLGSGAPGYTFSQGYQDVLNSLVECGSVVSISAGNSYNWAQFLPSGDPYIYLEDVSLHTGGSPGSFVNSLGVAAANNVGTVAAPMYFNDDQTVAYNESLGYGNQPIADIAGKSLEYVLVDGPGVDDNNHVGQEGDAFMAIGSNVLSGKIAMCYRGTSSFFAKANAAAAQGAAAVIIINNQAGVINMNLTGYEYDIPAVTISKADGDAVLAASEPVTDADGNILYYTGKVEVTTETQPIISNDRENVGITDFSSWGVPGSLIMKPEITAPGGDIYSVWGANNGPSSPTKLHDQYESMSGTSMAAPHVAGMAALVGQYIRENNLEEITGQNRRTLINSLLMGTATPMIVDGNYLSILQQGAGLGEAYLATQAMSYITMNEDATASWQDGKVKVELGQDAKREGVYTYSFNINNFSDIDLTYELNTDMFIQWIAGPDRYGNLFMDTETAGLELDEDYTAEYEYPTNIPNDHDVNMDGKTDKADAQAILDKMTGEYAEDADFDADAADMDGDGKYTSYDAHQLLAWLEEMGDDLRVPAHDSVTVKVTITYADGLKDFLDYYFTNGTYVQGYTYVTPTTETEDGAMLDVEQSIPILGFYGSWTDASMFDCVSLIDYLYGGTKTSYTGNIYTNCLMVNYGIGTEPFVGNPYAAENEFPTDRLALNTSTMLESYRYNQIRNAATAGAMALDSDGNILNDTIAAGNFYGAWYYVNGGKWQDNTTKSAAIGWKVGDLGLVEDDTFTLDYFAVPEYYGMLLHPGEEITSVTAEEILQLMEDGELGEGAYMGYTFTVDDTAPEIKEASIRDGEDGGKILSVTVRDNQYVAFVTLLDALGDTITDENGQNKIKGIVPEQTEPGQTVTVEFEITEDLGDGVTILACDYATNESAKLGTINEPMILGQKTIYVLTDTLEDGKNYVFAASNVAGDTKAMMLPETVSRYGGDMVAGDVTVVAEDDRTYIELADGQESMIWTAEASGNYFNLNNVGVEGVYPYVNSPRDGQVLMYYPYNYGEGFNLDPTAHTLYYNNEGTKIPFAYDPATDQVVAHRTNADRAPFYAYVETLVDDVFDPTQAYSVTVNPGDVMMVLGGAPAQLTAIVKPLVLENKAVTWSSDNEDVATVDENGVVTAVAGGKATITATSVHTPTVSDSAEVTVIEVDRDLNGIVWDENGQVWPSAFNLTTLPEYEKLIDTPMKTRLTSLTYDEEGIMWACDLDTDEGLSSLYTVDPKTWEPTLVGESEIGYMDLCMAPSLGDYLLGVFGTYVVIIDKATGNYESAFDLSDYIQGDLVGIAYEEQYEHSAYGNTDWVWLVDSAGYLYQTGFLPYGGSFSRFGVTPVGQIADAVDVSYFQSLYYDGTDLYWSRFNEADNKVNITMVLDLYGDGIIADVGSFADGVWPVGGLFQMGVRPFFDAEASVPADLTEDVHESATVEAAMEMVDVETLRASVQPSASKMPAGGLNAVTGTAGSVDVKLSAVAIDKDASNEETKVINITEDEEVTNGKYEVTYDPEKLTFVKDEAAHETYSIHVDEENGVITVAFADLEAVAADETIAKLTFTVSCEDDELTVNTTERNDELDLTETETLAIEGIGHDWGEPEWTWSEDYSTATAKFVCGNNNEHVEEIEAEVTSETTDPTCTENGETVYTATVTGPDGEEYTDTKSEPIDATGHTAGEPVIENNVEPTCTVPGSYDEVVYCTVCGEELSRETKTVNAIGHDWGEPMWTWNDGEATATFTCKNDSAHVEEVKASVTSVVTEPTCEQGGTVVYTGTVTGPDGKVYTNMHADITDPNGHDWGEPEWTWSEDHTMAVLTFTCKTDARHTTTVKAVVTSEVTDPTCTEAGEAVYTAVATFNGEEYTDVVTETTEALGHIWGEPEWSWDGDKATATFTCANDAAHVETVEATVSTETTDPTCEDAGETVYTATVTFDGEEYTDSKTETIEALGHTEGEVEIENEVEPTCTEDGSYDEVVYCEVCGEELSREIVTVAALGHTEGEVEIENNVEPTCTEPGSYDEVVYCEVCGEELSRVTKSVEALGHDWGEPVWTWDGNTATATFTCKNDPAHVETIEATMTSEVTDPTCEADGTTVYTATVIGPDGKEYTDTMAEITDLTGHDWGEPVFTWSEDMTTVTATFTCKTDARHTMTVEATVTKAATEATCAEDGKIVYTATVTGPDGKDYTESKTVTLPAMEHEWGEPVWTWSKDHKTATATFTCKVCGETVTVTDTAILTETAEDGKITYTASIVGPDGKTYTTTFVGAVPTGDSMNLVLCAGLMAVSAAGAFILLRSLKKKENRG